MNGFALLKHELLRIHVEYLSILHFLDIFISRFVQAFLSRKEARKSLDRILLHVCSSASNVAEKSSTADGSVCPFRFAILKNRLLYELMRLLLLPHRHH